MWNKIKDLGFVDSWRNKILKRDQFILGLITAQGCLMMILKEGLRIDHILLSENIEHAIVNTGIDYSARAMEKPSDHCPFG